MSSALRILVVDDNQDSADALARLLSSLGHETCVAYDALEALIAAIPFGPDVAILDVSMPGFSGYDLAHELRSARQPQCLLIALTGLPLAEVQERGGFDQVLAKPVSLETLRTLLNDPDQRMLKRDSA